MFYFYEMYLFDSNFWLSLFFKESSWKKNLNVSLQCGLHGKLLRYALNVGKIDTFVKGLTQKYSD